MASKTLTICDRCSKDIDTGIAFKVKAGVQDFDLCSECRQQFNLFVKGNEVTSEAHV